MAHNHARVMMAALVLALGTAPLAAYGGPGQQPQQQPPQEPAKQPAPKTATKSNEITKTFTIQAIDHASRLITLKDADGNIETLTAGPQVQRFDELKVGDKVTFKYFESVLYTIRKSASGSAKKTSETVVARDEGGKPSATMVKKLTATVEVTAIDPAASSVTVKTQKGETLTFKVKDKKNLEGVAVGDHVDITYSMALAVAVQ